MARIKINPLVILKPGKWQGQVIQSNYFGSTLKNCPQITRNRSRMQLNRNLFFMQAARRWRDLTQTQRNAWATFAADYPRAARTGYGSNLNAFQVFEAINYYNFLATENPYNFMDVPNATNYLPDAYTAEVKSDGATLTVDLSFTTADDSLNCLLFCSKTNYPSLHYIGSGMRYLQSVTNHDQTVDITAAYLAYFGRLPAEGETIFFGMVQTAVNSGQVYFASPEPVAVQPAFIPIADIAFGLLYNAPAILNAKGFFASGWSYPYAAAIAALVNLAGGYSYAGGVLKDASLDYWLSPNTAAVNSLGISIRGAGRRLYTDGSYQLFKQLGGISYNISTSVSSSWALARYNAAYMQSLTNHPKSGIPIRALRSNPSMAEGETSFYTGNDGQVYSTIKRAGYEWTQTPLAETKYSDGSLIPVVTDNAAWVADTDGACCYPNGDENNVYAS